jgi:predicted outer membrane protein
MMHRFGLCLIALGLAACAQGTEEPTDTTEQAASEGVAAETPKPAEARRHHKHDPAKLIEKLDENKNGTLELTELPEHKKRWLEGADTDKNGSLSVQELEAHKQQMGKRGHGKRGRFMKDPAAMIEKLDANENGTLELSELPEHKREKLGAADTDKDEKLSVQELKAHFEARRKEHGAHFDKPRARDEQAL